MTTVRQLLSTKNPTIWSVDPSDNVFDCIKLMADKDIGGLVVIDNGQFVGLVTERQYARSVALKGRTSSKTQVREVMRTDFVCARAHFTVEQCMALMTAKQSRYLPVVEDGTLLGIISIGDLVKSIIKDQEFPIDQLEHYIAGAT